MKKGEKERREGEDGRKKRIEAQRAKLRTPSPVIDALIGDEEQTEKKEEKTKKETERISNIKFGIFTNVYLAPETLPEMSDIYGRNIRINIQRALSVFYSREGRHKSSICRSQR